MNQVHIPSNKQCWHHVSSYIRQRGTSSLWYTSLNSRKFCLSSHKKIADKSNSGTRYKIPDHYPLKMLRSQKTRKDWKPVIDWRKLRIYIYTHTHIYTYISSKLHEYNVVLCIGSWNRKKKNSGKIGGIRTKSAVNFILPILLYSFGNCTWLCKMLILEKTGWQIHNFV